MIRILAILMGLCVLAAGTPTNADTAPRQLADIAGPGVSLQFPPCKAVQLEEAIETFDRRPRENAVRGFEVIVEGTIETYRLPDTVPDLHGPGLAILRVDKVWKGIVTPRVAWTVLPPRLFYGEPPAQPMLDKCPLAIPVGQRIRIGARILSKAGDQGDRYPELDPSTVVLDPDLFRRFSYWGSSYLPLHDRELDRLLAAYQAKTEALRQAAATGDVQARLDFAAHLLAHNQGQRAQEIADAMRRDGIKLASFGAVELTGERKDRSDLKRIHNGCYSYHANLDGAVFDRADFAECVFRYSSFRDASFRGTDLAGSYFQDSDLTGAKYDCATRLPDDLDPVAAGMVNVEGECHAP
jgi:hypothetical protein